MDKDSVQQEIERIAKRCHDYVYVATEDVLRRREEAKRNHIENAKRYAYERAQENKYGALQYIK